MELPLKIPAKHTICIHIDKKADKRFYEALESISKCFDNIILAKKREDVIYAHFTRLQVQPVVTISCLSNCYLHSGRF